VPPDSAIHFEDLDAEEDDQFLRTQKRVAVRRSPLPKKTANRVKKAVVVASVLAVVGLATWGIKLYGSSSWRFRLESSDNIEITGAQNVSRAQMLDVFAEDIDRNIFFVTLEERKKQLEEIPWVESATVMRLLPNRLAINVRERTPVAFVKIGPKISLIDANGVVMGLPQGKPAKFSFPIIQGMTDDEPLSSRAASMKIYNRLARELDSDTTAPSPYLKDISEVDLSDPVDVKVKANNANGTVVVHLGNTDFLARYQMYLAHIAEWKQQYPNLRSINLGIEGQIVVNQDAK
jgi:cell division protein FtsQ